MYIFAHNTFLFFSLYPAVKKFRTESGIKRERLTYFDTRVRDIYYINTYI